ncbi:sensor histidine kinase [Aquincola sp. S2]|uniref:histidine kinase n=1 Tax=Pseudaquabacterium terrae TaxID=2732868 RepID=A0ABX2E902_9BURK|nr:sensor histidine kinase [Aquabacterium terrae]NRF65361.1 sensor histidine kinase [Aquabacterium terrae]
MPDPARRRASLRTRLLVLLLPALALLAGAGLWLTRADAVAAANAAYDRSLLGAIKALELNVSTASGGLAVELPYRLFEFFQLTASGTVHFRVATADGLVEIGSPDLPPPPAPLRSGEPQFYDAAYFGEPLRLGVLKRPLERPLEAPLGESREIVIQVGESTVSRERFTSAFVRRALQRDLVLLALLVVAVIAVSTVVLRPLARLAADTRARAADDLRPLDPAGLPADVLPLVDAVNQQLARSEQLLDQRRRFVDDASHQLRTPLTTLRAQLDYALREADPVRARGALQALSAALDQAIRATNQLLVLARSDAAVPRQDPFDLGELAREVALQLLPLARERSLDFGLDVPEDPLPVRGDRALLHEALLNLGHNAIEHGRGGGTVTLQAAADGLGASLAVIDDGPGLAPEVSGQAGERFAKSRGSRGSGLGLAIAKTVIQRHRGRLRLEPRDDGPGLRASLWWPR